MSTTLTSVTNHFPKPQDGFTTTTSGSISSGATSVGLNSTGSYSNGDIVVLIIDPTDASKKQAFTGTVDTSGVQITGVVCASGTNQNHSAGATIVDYVAATHLGMVSKGILVAHDQAGVHKSGATYALPVITDFTNATHTHAANAQGGSLNGANAITDGTITPAELTSGTGSSWVWQSWTPTLSGQFTNGDWTKSCVYIQIGKTVFYRISLVSADATPMAGGAGVGTMTLPVTSVSYSGTATLQPIGQAKIYDASTTNRFNGATYWASTTTMSLKWFQVSGTAISDTDVDATNPMTWTTSDEITIQGFYEAA